MPRPPCAEHTYYRCCDYSFQNIICRLLRARRASPYGSSITACHGAPLHVLMCFVWAMTCLAQFGITYRIYHVVMYINYWIPILYGRGVPRPIRHNVPNLSCRYVYKLLNTNSVGAKPDSPVVCGAHELRLFSISILRAKPDSPKSA